MARFLGGQAVPVQWIAVESLNFTGPSVGVGLDPAVERAYINGSAFGNHSLAVNGPDAGEYECGHLYKRMLIADACSAFVHIPKSVSFRDWGTVLMAIVRVRVCASLDSPKHH